MSELEIIVGDFTISRKDLPDGLVGRIMLDIIFCQAECCRDKQAFLELLEHTAKEIIRKVREYDGEL
jgi:hypothetical protein